MHWTIAAPFNRPGDRWLAPFVPGEHTFEVVARPGAELNWHERRSSISSPREWFDYARQARAALSCAGRDGGVITVFPQLAAAVGALARVQRCDVPTVAWFFNTAPYRGVRRHAARMALRHVERFVVHTQVERTAFMNWLGLPLERSVFVPLQYGGEVAAGTEPDDDEPFVLAVGSGHRDFRTLFAALDHLRYPTVVISSARALHGLSPPACVDVRERVPRAEIRRLVQRARINVIPMTTDGIVAGTVTIVETMRHGRGPVVTRRAGVGDYVTHERSGLLVEPFDRTAMRDALQRAWEDAPLRARIDAGAAAFAGAHCTDEAAGRALGRILDELESDRRGSLR
jgi:glycosyltransferase involved in cell wall biosynthesis